MSKHDQVPGAGVDVALTDWDDLLADVTTRLHLIAGAARASHWRTASGLLECAQALEHLDSTPVNKDSRRRQLDLARFDLRMAQAMSGAGPRRPERLVDLATTPRIDGQHHEP
jgi:hypothetical protein